MEAFSFGQKIKLQCDGKLYTRKQVDLKKSIATILYVPRTGEAMRGYTVAAAHTVLVRLYTTESFNS